MYICISLKHKTVKKKTQTELILLLILSIVISVVIVSTSRIKHNFYDETTDWTQSAIRNQKSID